MPSVRVPIVVWEDHAGFYTARVIAGSDVAATDKSAAAAADQLKRYLEWSARRDGWRPPWSLDDPRLEFIDVSVRPEYAMKHGRFPIEEAISLRVAFVHGSLPGKATFCTAPTLDVAFQCHADDSVKELAGDAVRAALAKLTPRDLARHLPPKRFELAAVTVKVRPAAARANEPDVENLRLVADPAGDRGLRRRFGAAWQRNREIADLAARLSAGRGNVLLVGDGGVGKTAVLVNAVRQLERRRDATTKKPSDDRPRKLDDDGSNARPRVRHRFWLTNASRLIAGMQYLGQWEERCEAVIGELSEIGGVLCVENLLDLVRQGGREPTNSLAAFFAPYLEHNELRIVAEATPTELAACRRLLPGLVELFQIVAIEPLDRPGTTAVLDRVIETLRQNSHIEPEDGVAELAHRLFRRFMPYRPLPGPAALFLRQLWEQAQIYKWPRVQRHHVIERFTRDTGLPDFLLRDDVALQQRDVLAEFERRVLGQPAACVAAASLVTTFKAGLNDPGRPLGVLLFCGPTGVGKTELANTLADYLFGAGEKPGRLVRLDMSEYAAPGAADRLLTQPDGQPSELIKRLRSQPFSVVLLDEIEKAAPEVFDVLLGVLDEGRLTDRFGRTTNFRSAVVVMTSNLGGEHRGAIGFESSVRSPYERAVTSFFRPEFFNRIDAVVTFEQLGTETIEAITRKELSALARREGLAERGLRIEWSDGVVRHLAAAGFDARYGARPLQRTLEKLAVAPLSRWLLDHPAARQLTLSLELDAKHEIVVRIVG